MRWIEKMDYTVFDGLDELCHHAKFGDRRIHRAPAVGAKTCCVYVFFSVTLESRFAVGSTVTYFEQMLCRGLLADFDNASTIIFSIDCPFKCTRLP